MVLFKILGDEGLFLQFTFEMYKKGGPRIGPGPLYNYN